MNTPNPGTPPPPGHQPPPPGQQPAPPPQYQQPQQYPPQYGQPAPGPYGQPGQPGFNAAPPAKKRRWWIWVLAILAVFGLLIGACSYVVFRALTGPIDKANEVLALLEDGDIEDAKDELDFDCFGNDGLDEFEDFFEAFPVESYDLTSSANENGRGTVTGRITLDDGVGSRPISFDLTNDDGWKVCGIDIDNP